MIIEIIIAVLLGVIAGTISGLIPGIHTNLISALIIASLPLLLTYASPLLLAILIISMALTHTFTSAIPSIFLGAPDGSMALATLPGHQLLMKGKGYHAVYLTVIGSIIAVILAVLTAPLTIPIIKSFYNLAKQFIPIILVLAAVVLILKEKHSKFWAIICFTLAGILGIATFSLPVNQPFLPLLTGLFGASLLLLSLKNKNKIPRQKITRPRIKTRDMIKIIPRGGLASLLCAFLPGVGSSTAAILAMPSRKEITKEQFLILIGSIDTFVMIFDLITFYAISKTRNGSIIAVSQILPSISSSTLLTLIISILAAAVLASLITTHISKYISKILPRLNYSFISIAVLLFLAAITLIITGPLGLLVLMTATALGIIAQTKGIRKSHLMGCLIIPTILNSLL